MSSCSGNNTESTSPDSRPTSAASSTPKVSDPIVMRGEGTLSRPYAAPSLGEFAKQDFIVNVVIGTVSSTRVVYDADTGGEPATITTLLVESTQDPTTIKDGTMTVVESGGVISFRDTRSQFAAHLSTEELAEYDRVNPDVDFQPGGQKHSAVGQRQLVFVAHGADGTGSYAAVRLVANAEGVFGWYGEPLVAQWPDVDLTNRAATTAFQLVDYK